VSLAAVPVKFDFQPNECCSLDPLCFNKIVNIIFNKQRYSIIPQIYSASQSPNSHEEEARRCCDEEQMSALPGELSKRRCRTPTHTGGSPG
jgi:hypothetical protein